jgi:hypothetical protein
MLARTIGKILYRMKGSIPAFNKEASFFLLALCSILKLYKAEDGLRDQATI